ncbi:uncharacterized protein LOC133320741 [Danaus plexippus]|uniref:uncharacterized protein LOC133320741 n=1 Tax=Danaus plexippus TaxID=13037 RepID=UPI002AB31335|nr:uncharacterized protein LOC133320741 [Danaus plexippus]
MDKIIQFVPYPQEYKWGKKGSSGVAGSFWKHVSANNNVSPSFSEEKNYAEIWFGLHSKSINYAIPSLQILKDLTPHREKDILLKIISCNEPLSLQLHPDEESAHKLNRDYPSKYPEPKPKPEMSVSLSETVEMFCGRLKPSESDSLSSCYLLMVIK